MSQFRIGTTGRSAISQRLRLRERTDLSIVAPIAPAGRLRKRKLTSVGFLFCAFGGGVS